MENQKVIEALQEKFPEAVVEVSAQFGDDTLVIQKKALQEIMDFLYPKPYEFTMLLDLTCVDYMGETPRYQMVYHVYSMTHSLRLRIKAAVGEGDLTIDSLEERELAGERGVRHVRHPL